MTLRLPSWDWLLFSAILVFCPPVFATFSIVAVDTVTNEVGSVGASCIDTTMSGLRNLRIDRISEIVPGRGAINGQQNWAQAELAVARQRMAAGDSPAQILARLMQPQYNPQNYQYLIIDLFNGRPRDTAFTGTNGTQFKGHLIGRDYALAGNLLLGAHVLDSMRNAFVRSAGQSLPDRLMAGILGAKFAGADGRCLSRGVSSLSAYIRVARPNDSGYLHIAFGWVPPGTEPLDELKRRFDIWKAAVPLLEPKTRRPDRITISGGMLQISFSDRAPDRIAMTDASGKAVRAHWRMGPKSAQISLVERAKGLYFIHWYENGVKRGSGKVAIVR